MRNARGAAPRTALVRLSATEMVLDAGATPCVCRMGTLPFAPPRRKPSRHESHTGPPDASRLAPRPPSHRPCPRADGRRPMLQDPHALSIEIFSERPPSPTSEDEGSKAGSSVSLSGMRCGLGMLRIPLIDPLGLPQPWWDQVHRTGAIEHCPKVRDWQKSSTDRSGDQVHAVAGVPIPGLGDDVVHGMPDSRADGGAGAGWKADAPRSSH